MRAKGVENEKARSGFQTGKIGRLKGLDERKRDVRYDSNNG